MFVPGPKSTETFSFKHSSPRASPIFSIRSGSHEQAVADAVGKQIAGTPFKRLVSPFFAASGSPFLRIP